MFDRYCCWMAKHTLLTGLTCLCANSNRCARTEWGGAAQRLHTKKKTGVRSRTIYVRSAQTCRLLVWSEHTWRASERVTFRSLHTCSSVGRWGLGTVGRYNQIKSCLVAATCLLSVLYVCVCVLVSGFHHCLKYISSNCIAHTACACCLPDDDYSGWMCRVPRQDSFLITIGETLTTFKTTIDSMCLCYIWVYVSAGVIWNIF